MVVLISLVSGGLAVGHIAHARQAQLDRIVHEGQNLAAILDLSLAGVLDGVALNLHAVSGEADRQRRAGGWDIAALTAFIEDRRPLVPALETMALADGSGNVVARSGPAITAPLNVADRDYFEKSRVGDGHGLHITAPVVSRSSGRWVLPVAHRMTDDTGAFAGVVFGTIPIDFLREVFRPLELGERDRIGIRDREFKAIVQFPEQVTEVGKVEHSPTTASNLISRPLSSSYLTVRAADGVHSAIAYRRLAQHPIYIVVGLAVDSRMGFWHREALAVAISYIGFILALTAGAALLLRAWNRVESERNAALSREREFREVLESFPQPVGIADANGRILHSNRCFETTFGYALSEIPTVEAWLERAYPDPEYRNQAKTLWEADLAAALAAGSSTREREYRITRKDGRVRTVSICARHVGDRLVVTFLDVTERREAENALRASETLLRELFDHNRDGFVVIDPKGRIVDANAAYCSMLGYTREELQRLDDIFQITPERWHRWERDEILGRQMLEQGHASLYEKEYIRKDGTVIPIELSAFVVHGDDGGVRHYWGVVREISDRRRAEQELRASERLFREAIEFLPIAVGISAADRRMLVANRMFTDVFGYGLDELQTVDRWMELVFPDPAYRQQYIIDQRGDLDAQSTARPEPLIHPYRVRCKDGSHKQLVMRRRLIEGRIFAVFEDVTRQQADEEQLRQYRDHLEDLVRLRSQELDTERRRFEQYFTLSRALTVALDLRGRIVRINPYACDLLGWTEAELVGRDWFTTCLSSEEGQRVHDFFVNHVATAPSLGSESFAATTYENSILARDGRVYRMLFRNAWLRDEAGEVTGTISSAIDITPLREAEEALSQAKETAERANRAKSEFLANMSHEIRTPLNAVLGYAQVLARDPGISDAQRQAVQVINRSGEHLLQLINDVLEMSRIEAGRTTCDAEDFDLHVLLDNLQSLFLQRAADKGLALLVAHGEELPRFVRTDQRKFRQILINLLSNAVKFTREGHVSLAAAYREGRLTCIVSDTGPGMTPEELARLGQPFVQAETGRRRGDGAGLGLAISHGFARLLGGALTSCSVPGTGTSFHLDVPAEVVEHAVHRPARMQAIGIAPGQRIPHVLIAEDHIESRELLATLLIAAGCEVEAVGDGAAAVEACRQRRPELVWMDIDMPVMDGLCATAAIRALPGRPPVIVALTAAAFVEDRSRFLAGGCDEVANKPFHDEDLFRLMERLLEIRFVWKEAEERTPTASLPDDGDLRDRLALVAPADLDRLAEAVVTGDVDAGFSIIAAMPDRALAAALHTLLNSYQFDRLQALLDTRRRA